MKIQEFTTNNLHIILAILLPTATLFSHSVGHDEWSYFLEVYLQNPTGFIDPVYKIIFNLKEFFTIPRYLLGFLYLDSIVSLTNVASFWIFLILYIIPNIFLFRFIINSQNNIYLFALTIAIAYFNIYTNFYHLGFLYLLSSLHSKSLRSYVLFFIGATFHPVAFIGAIFISLLAICKKWDIKNLIPALLLILGLLSSAYYSFSVQQNLLGYFEETSNVVQSSDINETSKDIETIKDIETNSIQVTLPDNKVERSNMEILKNDLGFEKNDPVPILFRVGFSYNKMISITFKRLFLFILVLTCFIFFRNKKFILASKFFTLIPSILLVFYLSSLNILGQAIHGGPGLFIAKYFMNSIDKSIQESYVMPPTDSLMMKSMFNNDVDNINLGNKNCEFVDDSIISFLPPFVSVFDLKKFTSKANENCLPIEILDENFQPYGILYEEESIIAQCIDKLIDKNPYIGLKTQKFNNYNFFYFHYYDAPNTQYSNINKLSFKIFNCSLNYRYKN